MSGAVPKADAQKIPTSPPIGTDEELIERFRNASKLAQSKFVNNASELFDLAANALQSRISEVERLSARVSELEEECARLRRCI